MSARERKQLVHVHKKERKYIHQRDECYIETDRYTLHLELVLAK